MMKKGLFITLPRHDLATEYLSAFSSPIIEFCKSKGVSIKKISNEDVNKISCEKAIKKLDYNFLLFNGHGGPDCITGHNMAPIIELGKNDSLLKNRIVYARSCWAASQLGQHSTNKSIGCFIGYDIPFMFLHDLTRSATPQKDTIAQPFFKTTNLIATGLLKGKSTKEVHETSKKAMLKEMKKALLNNEPALLETLFNNHQGQVIYGNLNAKM